MAWVVLPELRFLSQHDNIPFQVIESPINSFCSDGIGIDAILGKVFSLFYSSSIPGDIYIFGLENKFSPTVEDTELITNDVMSDDFEQIIDTISIRTKSIRNKNTARWVSLCEHGIPAAHWILYR